MAKKEEKQVKTKDTPKINPIYYDKNGEYIFNSDGSCEVKSFDPKLTGLWDDANYISPEQYQNLKLSLHFQGAGGDSLKTIEGFIEEPPYDRKGGRVILLKYTEKDGKRISAYGKSEQIFEKRPPFKQQGSETGENSADDKSSAETVPLEEIANEGHSR